MSQKARTVDETVWMALSARGWLVPMFGYAFRRKDLAADYKARFGHTPKEGGYRLVKVRVTKVSR